MKILLFGITNVGKTTIGKILSKRLNYAFDDLDDEIKRRYEKIDNFQAKYPFDYDRHKERGKILKEIIDNYDDNVVIAVSPIYYEEFFIEILEDDNILAIELQDEPENILKRLVYSDENDIIYPIAINTEKDRKYYIKDIKVDIKYYEKVYEKIENKFELNGKLPEEIVDNLLKYINTLNKNEEK